MYAKFECSRKLRQFLKKKKQLSLSDAEKMICAADDYAIQKHFTEDVNFKIVDQDGVLYEDNLPIGTGQGWLHNLLLILKHAYQTVLTDQSPEAFKAFSDRVQAELMAEEQVHAKQIPLAPGGDQVSKPVAGDSTQNNVSETPLEEKVSASSLSQSGRKSSVQQAIRRLKCGELHHSWSIKRPHVRISSRMLKRIGLVIATISMVALFLTFWMKPKPVPSYQSLMHQSLYVQAARLYPRKQSDIEAKLVKDSDEKKLAVLVKKYPTNNGKFDLAYMQRNFTQVISESKSVDLTAVRKVKLAISYIYENQPENALTINAEIKSQQLQQLIFLALVHEGKLDQATTLAKSMNNKDADKVLAVGKTYQAAYEKAKADANNPKLSTAERKQAVKDQQNWLALRKAIGGKSPYEQSTSE